MNDIFSELNPSQQSLYLNLVRFGAGFIYFTSVDGFLIEKHFKDDAQSLTLIDTYGRKANTWVLMATFTNPIGTRRQTEAESLCSLWLDVDAYDGSTHAQGYYVSESTVYRLVKSHDLITSPAFVVIKATNEFKDKTTGVTSCGRPTPPTSR